MAIIDLENSTATESVELQNISNSGNDLKKNNVNKYNIVILGDSTKKPRIWLEALKITET